MILIIDRKNSVVKYQTGCLRVEYPGEPFTRIPIRQLECVIIYGNPLIETAVWRYLAKAGVAAIALSSRGPATEAILGTGLNTSLPFRRLQHKHANNKTEALTLATWFVQSKLQAYELATLAMRHNTGKSEQFMRRQQQALEKLSTLESLPALLGTEGAMASAWFSLYASACPSEWGFSGRNRRPPRDPVNALLSLSYTLLFTEVRQLLIHSGLDPSLGFLHQDYPGRDGLALDLMEAFRPCVDIFVFEFLIHGVITIKESFFYRKENGCRMSKLIRSDYFSAWADFRENWPVYGQQQEIVTTPLRTQINNHIARFKQQLKQPDTHGE